MGKTQGTRNYWVAAAAVIASIHLPQAPAVASDGSNDAESQTGLNIVVSATGGNATSGGAGGSANAIGVGTGSVIVEANGGEGATFPPNPYLNDAGDGDSGGSAAASATATADSSGNSSANANAFGGGAARGNNSTTPVQAGYDGAGGLASATANSTSSSTGTAIATATVVAGSAYTAGYAQNGSTEDSAYEVYATGLHGISLTNQATAVASGGVYASATANQTAGQGGGGTFYNPGGDGGNSTLINAVSATVSNTTIGSIYLTQIAMGGCAGGVNSLSGLGGIAGNSGSATSILNPSGTIAAYWTNTTLQAVGSTSADSTGSANTVGGSATVGEVISATNNLNLNFSAIAGYGGEDDDSDGGQALLGGANVTPGSTGNVSVNATSTGGGSINLSATVQGGFGSYSSYYAGNGGAALQQSTINLTTTGNITAELQFIGGDGGQGRIYGVTGGNGADATSLSNAFNISASTTSNVLLIQSAKGGSGAIGYTANGTASNGFAGNALSNATYSLDVATLSLYAIAVGGNDTHSGGTATAIANATNTNITGIATATANATAGSSGSGYATATAYASATVDGVTVDQLVITTNGSSAYASVSLSGSSSGPTLGRSGGYGNITIGPTCSSNSTYTQTGGTLTFVNLSIGDTSLTCPYLATYNMQGGTLTVTSCTTLNHTGTFNQTGGNASLGNVSGNGTITLTGGSLTATTLSMPSGSVSANSTLTFTSTSATRQTSAVVIEIGNLTVGTAGKIDLANHDLIIHGGSNLSQVAALITSAYDSGAWDGDGIGSSTVASATDKAIGYATAGELGISTFDGIAVSSTDILVKYTWQGDANLDGKVNLTDENIVLNNLGSPGDWSMGDMNYDGSVGLSDLNLVSNHLGDGSSSPLAVVATPEPGSLIILGIASPLLLRRRKSRAIKK